MDRQAIERRDFPIGRRGYDPAAVDAHLRALAAEFEELQRASAGAEPSLASTAATQVQSILTAAETAAADIGRQALQGATEAREEAARDAERTREEAIAQARAHVTAVAQATAVLLERVSAMDAEVGALVESLRAGAGRLAADLAAVGTNMGELYDAASGRSGTDSRPAVPDNAVAQAPPASASVSSTPTPSPTPTVAPVSTAAPAATAPAPAVASPPTAPAPARPAQAPEAAPQPVVAAATPAQPAGAAPAGANGDLDSARLVALNMALNGESRAEADRYLAENFQLADRGKLIDEVYAAIEA